MSSRSRLTRKKVDRYRTLMQEVEHLVVDKYDGSLKAEHGTGRNMAPFVKLEWGEGVRRDEACEGVV